MNYLDDENQRRMNISWNTMRIPLSIYSYVKDSFEIRNESLIIGLYLNEIIN